MLALSLATQTVVDGFILSSSFFSHNGASLRSRTGFSHANAAPMQGRGLRGMRLLASNVNAPIVLPEGLYRLNAEMRLAVSRAYTKFTSLRIIRCTRHLLSRFLQTAI